MIWFFISTGLVIWNDVAAYVGPLPPPPKYETVFKTLNPESNYFLMYAEELWARPLSSPFHLKRQLLPPSTTHHLHPPSTPHHLHPPSTTHHRHQQRSWKQQHPKHSTITRVADVGGFHRRACSYHHLRRRLDSNTLVFRHILHMQAG